MTGLNDLSTELLLLIARYLPSGALHSLALTSKDLSTTAYDELYKKLHLPTPDSDASNWSHRIFFLVRTLSMRPDLAERTVELDVSVCSQDIHRHSGGRITVHTAATDRILDVVPVGSQRANQRWVWSLYGAHSQAWLGLLLYMLPNLEDLTARFFEKPEESPPRVYFASYGNLFGDPDIDVSTVPGLRKVRNLELHCRASTWKLCCLPNLERIRVSPRGELSLWIHHEICEPSSQLQELFATQTTGILRAPFNSHFYHERSLGSTPFSALRRLDISLHNHEGLINAEFIGSFAAFLPKIEPMAHTLEELRVMVSRGADSVFLNFVDPVPIYSLTRLHKLKVLWVPQALLLPRGFDSLVHRNEVSMNEYTYLPTTLEELRVSHPTLKIHSWLKELVVHRYRLTHLQHIGLMIALKQDADFAGYNADDAEVWNEITSHGINTRIIGCSTVGSDQCNLPFTEKNQLLFEIALRDRRIQELEEQLVD